MMAVPKISDNFQTTEGCKIISPHHFHPTNGVSPTDSYGVNRGEFRIHPGSKSFGCITFSNNQ